MSHNLRLVGGGSEFFLFQTPTEVTRAVLAEPTRGKRAARYLLWFHDAMLEGEEAADDWIAHAGALLDFLRLNPQAQWEAS